MVALKFKTAEMQAAYDSNDVGAFMEAAIAFVGISGQGDAGGWEIKAYKGRDGRFIAVSHRGRTLQNLGGDGLRDGASRDVMVVRPGRLYWPASFLVENPEVIV